MPRDDIARFWDGTRQALATIEASPSMEEIEEQSGREYTTYRVGINSYGGQRIRAWYSVPKHSRPNEKLPAVMTVPGYSGEKPIPVHLAMTGYAVLTMFPRGQGESKAEWELEFGTKLTYHVTDRDRFYYRGAFMDCVRGIDFLCSRPEIDSSRIGMWGRSQGGGLTLATSSLDTRLSAAIAEEPFICNYPVAASVTTSPYVELHDYLAEHADQRDAALATLEYFDPLNLADAIRCPILVNIGMQDDICPYPTIAPVFDKITTQKALAIYPDLGHSPCTDFNTQGMDWLRRCLG
jgi:cephalosporin-C deacetylase